METSERGASEDIAIFPLAIPLLTSAGTITSVLALVFLLTRPVIGLGGQRLTHFASSWRSACRPRMLGILLAASAVQFLSSKKLDEFIRLLQGGRA